ncbi:MurR/RpiR family transcriptional regulator, partial [Variovorax sp. YR752]|uniref:MurR/RpiR family transcriptional regulator n=1 Tax=Variovorax sp. YR752 TaxID=1884383 RepID=UPI00313842FE
MSATTLSQLIGRRFDELSPEQQRAARWLQGHEATIALHSMRSAARQAGVSPATMTRLAQRLGFDGYEALRQPARRRLAAQAAPSAYAERARARQRSGAAARDRLDALNGAQQANVASVAARNGDGTIEAAADALLHASRVFFLGLRVCHGLAFHLHYGWGLLKANGTLMNDLGGTLADHALQIAPGDLLVAISQAPYTRRTVEAVALARRQGAAVLALTDSPLSPVARGAQHLLLFDTDSPSFFHSLTGAQALAESLLDAAAAR